MKKNKFDLESLIYFIIVCLTFLLLPFLAKWGSEL